MRVAIGMVGAVVAIGTIGFRILGLGWIDSLYMTVISITTVGYREIDADTTFGDAEKIFTMFLIVIGVSTVLYTFTLVVQTVVEGQLQDFVGRRRMDRRISQMRGHTIVCGWGRVGAAAAHDLNRAGHQVVVVDESGDRVRDLEFPVIVGDATRNDTLRAAGIDNARALIAALHGDADNLFVTLSGRDLRPDLFIVARARADESIPKLTHAGADRVVNPQELGAVRMASYVASPNVAEFIDLIMHERSVEFRMREFEIAAGSAVAGQTLRDANLREISGALVLALRTPEGTFITNPRGDTPLRARHVVIAVGTDRDFDRLAEVTSGANVS